MQEVLGLKWDMVKLWDTGGEIELVYTKNGKKRYIPLNKTMRELFLDLDRKSSTISAIVWLRLKRSQRLPCACGTATGVSPAFLARILPRFVVVFGAGVAKMVNTTGSHPVERKLLWVQIPPPAPPHH